MLSARIAANGSEECSQSRAKLNFARRNVEMTICIGALCADKNGEPNKAVVVASDRMVTLGNLTEFEHEGPKIALIRNKIVALMAGDALRSSQLIREVVAATPPESPKVEKVAEIAAGRYVHLRAKQIEVDVFSPRGFTREKF